MLVISGSTGTKLAASIANSLNAPYIPANISKFKDQELKVRIEAEFLAKTVILVHSTCPPANDHLMELLLITDVIKRNNPKRLIAVIPYFGYSRQDRLTSIFEPTSKELITNLLSASGIDDIITLDIHSNNPQTKVYNIPFFDIFFKEISKKISKNNVLIVAPDKGSSTRAQTVANYLNIPYICLNKTRIQDGTCHMSLATDDVPNCTNADCILIDDIVDNANTLLAAAKILETHKIKSINAYVTHGVLSGNAIETLNQSPIEHIYISDSIPQKLISNKITIVPTAQIITNFIQHNVINML